MFLRECWLLRDNGWEDEFLLSLSGNLIFFDVVVFCVNEVSKVVLFFFCVVVIYGVYII